MCCGDDCNFKTYANIFVLNISLLVQARANNPVQKAAVVPLSWSFFNGLLNHVIKELNVEEALKSSILVVDKAAAVPLSWSFLNGLLNHVVKVLNVEEVLKSPFFVIQKAADVARGLRISTNQRPGNYLTQTHRQTENRHTGRPCSTSSAFKNGKNGTN